MHEVTTQHTKLLAHWICDDDNLQTDVHFTFNVVTLDLSPWPVHITTSSLPLHLDISVGQAAITEEDNIDGCQPYM